MECHNRFWSLLIWWKPNCSSKATDRLVASSSDVWGMFYSTVVLGGGFKDCLFSPLLGEIIQFDEYFSDGLVQPPTSDCFVASLFVNSMMDGFNTDLSLKSYESQRVWWFDGSAWIQLWPLRCLVWKIGSKVRIKGLFHLLILLEYIGLITHWS